MTQAHRLCLPRHPGRARGCLRRCLLPAGVAVDVGCHRLFCGQHKSKKQFSGTPARKESKNSTHTTGIGIGMGMHPHQPPTRGREGRKEHNTSCGHSRCCVYTLNVKTLKMPPPLSCSANVLFVQKEGKIHAECYHNQCNHTKPGDSLLQHCHSGCQIIVHGFLLADKIRNEIDQLLLCL